MHPWSNVEKIFNRDLHSPPVLDLHSRIKKEKIVDVCKLLDARYGEEWRNLEVLKYYKNVCNEPSSVDHNEEQELCDCLDEEPGLERI